MSWARSERVSGSKPMLRSKKPFHSSVVKASRPAYIGRQRFTWPYRFAPALRGGILM
jgi:hypothetical protein